MAFCPNKQPNLIGPVMKSTICTIVKNPTINNTVSDKVASYIGDLYKEYVVDNKFMVILIILTIICLVYRYYNKPQSAEKFTQNKDKNLLKEIEEYQLNKLRYDNPPAMNPLDSIEDNEDLIYYPPDPLPVNIPGKGLQYSRDIYNTPTKPNPLNHVNYNHKNVYENPSRQYHTGTYNTYQNAQDTDILNPYNWSNNFNTNTGNFVGPMTDQNNKVLTDYQSIVDNTNNNLTANLGNFHNNFGSNIDLPYADD